MSLLYKILYAAHANGTHHKLALRCLELLEHPDAERWRRIMLAHATALLEGSKAPDKTFKDFQNHVLHPAHGPGGKAWGGAPKKAAEWADATRAAVAAKRWQRAAHAFGVLTHYYTDPWMPFHTGSSEEENVVHRAVEWSINKSFERLWERAEPTLPALKAKMAKALPAADKADWMEKMVSHAAETSAKRYRDLIEHYDFAVGSKRPEEGLDPTSEAFIAEMLGQAALGLAQILDRLAEETGATPPAVALTPRTVVAGLQIPSKWVTKKMSDAADRAAVEAMFAEFSQTGTVARTLPDEVRVVRAAKTAALDAEKARRARKDMDEDMKTLAARTPAARPALASRAQSRGGDLLERDAPVERAPSIGPKTATRLEAIGIATVGDLIDADPKVVARGLGDRRIDAKAIDAWRDQALLLTRVPRLKQAYAVLLVAAGYRDALSIAAAAPDALRRQLAATAEKPETKRLLRRVETPDLAAAGRIVENARAALAIAA